jgi:hypothetical protein
MSVPPGDYLERSIRSSIAAEHQFTVGPLPDRNAGDVGRPLLTAVFETKTGDLGLLTIYPRITIVELNSRYGMILKKTVNIDEILRCGSVLVSGTRRDAKPAYYAAHEPGPRRRAAA